MTTQERTGLERLDAMRARAFSDWRPHKARIAGRALERDEHARALRLERRRGPPRLELVLALEEARRALAEAQVAGEPARVLWQGCFDAALLLQAEREPQPSRAARILARLPRASDPPATTEHTGGHP